MTNCWSCGKPLVRQRFPDEHLECLTALRKRRTCHDNPECVSALMTHNKRQSRIKNAKWYYEFPDITERFILGRHANSPKPVTGEGL